MAGKPHRRRGAILVADLAREVAVVEREDPVATRFLLEALLEFFQQLGMLAGDVPGLGPVRMGVVQLPTIVVEASRGLQGLPGGAVTCHRQPAVVVDATIADDLEVLRRPAATLGLIHQAVDHADAVARLLRDAFEGLGRVDAGRLEDRGEHIDDVVPMLVDRSGTARAVRPMEDHPVAVPTVMRRDRFHPGQRRVHRHGPPHGLQGKCRGFAEFVEQRHHPLRIILQPAVDQTGVEGAEPAAFA